MQVLDMIKELRENKLRTQRYISDNEVKLAAYAANSNSSTFSGVPLDVPPILGNGRGGSPLDVPSILGNGRDGSPTSVIPNDYSSLPSQVYSSNDYLNETSMVTRNNQKNSNFIMYAVGVVIAFLLFGKKFKNKRR